MNGLLPLSIHWVNHVITFWSTRSKSVETKRWTETSWDEGGSIAQVSGEANHHDATLSSKNGRHKERGEGSVEIISVVDTVLEASSSSGTKDVGLESG
jgi:hypothetical protein